MTASRSCWCTMRSSNPTPSGRGSRAGASQSLTTTPGPSTATRGRGLVGARGTRDRLLVLDEVRDLGTQFLDFSIGRIEPFPLEVNEFREVLRAALVGRGSEQARVRGEHQTRDQSHHARAPPEGARGRKRELSRGGGHGPIL